MDPSHFRLAVQAAMRLGALLASSDFPRLQSLHH